MMISCLFVCVCLTESWWPEQIDIQSWSLRAEDFSGKTLSDFKTETVKETVKKKESHRRAEVRDRFDMKEKWYSSEKRAFSCGQEHNSLTLCWREPGCETRATAKRERQTQGGRVAGSERKWWARQTICWVCARLIENWWWEKWRAAVWGGGDYVVELMRMWCRGIKTKSSSRTRERHTGREVIPCYRCIMHGAQ